MILYFLNFKDFNGRTLSICTLLMKDNVANNLHESNIWFNIVFILLTIEY